MKGLENLWEFAMLTRLIESFLKVLRAFESGL